MGHLGQHQSIKTLRIRRERGFSLVEIGIVVTILAVLVAFAVPAFQETMLNTRLSSIANKLVATSHLARNEAIKRNKEVMMCVSIDGTTCTTGGWEQGWIACPTSDGATCDVSGTETIVLHRQQAVQPGFKITEANTYDILRFQPSGIGIKNAAGSLAQFDMTICRATPSVGNNQRVITFYLTGRAAVASTESTTCS